MQSFLAPSDTADSVIELLSTEDIPKIKAAMEASVEVGGDIQLVHLAGQCIARLEAGLTLDAAVEKLQEKRWVRVVWGQGVLCRLCVAGCVNTGMCVRGCAWVFASVCVFEGEGEGE
jgi:hypothetical protein